MPESKKRTAPNRERRRKLLGQAKKDATVINRASFLILEAAAREILVDTSPIILLSNESDSDPADIRRALARHYAQVVRMTGRDVEVSA